MALKWRFWLIFAIFPKSSRPRASHICNREAPSNFRFFDKILKVCYTSRPLLKVGFPCPFWWPVPRQSPRQKVGFPCPFLWFKFSAFGPKIALFGVFSRIGSVFGTGPNFANFAHTPRIRYNLPTPSPLTSRRWPPEAVLPVANIRLYAPFIRLYAPLYAL